jgi:hypothetical protein
MATITSTFLKIFHASGITTSSLAVSQFMLRHSKLLFLLHFKVIPTVLAKVSDPQLYSNLISWVSIGKTYKTTNFRRHNNSDDTIIDIISKLSSLDQKSFADIGVSDGSGSVYLIDKLKSLNVRSFMFDKYLSLKVVNLWYGYQYINEDNFIVGMKIFCFYIYVFPLQILSHSVYDSSIILINPYVLERNISVEYFDIFFSISHVPFDFVKIANVLNFAYFSKQEILKGLKNLHQSISNNGYLFIIRNCDNDESLLVLRKSRQGFSVEFAYNNPELLDLAECNRITWDI